MNHLTSIEKSLLIIKPDGIKRGLVGEIFKRIERTGLKLVASKMITATEEQARNNYPGTEDWLTKMGEKTFANYANNVEEIKKDMGTTDKLEIGKKIYDSLVKYMTDGPIILTVWEGNHAVQVLQKIIGATDPMKADIGTIRGDYGFDTAQLAVKSGRIVFQTIVHRSDSKEEAQREIDFWFGKNYKYLGEYSRTDYIGAFEAA